MTVDDSTAIRRMISFALKSTGHEVIEAVDGKQAFDVLKTRRVDLVISDINMPNMDGLTLTRQLRGLAEYKTTPIILLTTESAPEKKMEGRSAGATGWIVKPFEPNQLMQVVAKVLPN